MSKDGLSKKELILIFMISMCITLGAIVALLYLG